LIRQTDVARLRYGWWATLLVTLLLLVVELVEHRPNLFALELEFVCEALVLLALPLAGGLGLSWLQRRRLELVGTSVLFRRKATAVDRQHVLVVEDELLGQAVKSLLSQVKDFDIVGCAPRDEAELVEEIKRTRPAVVVLAAATQLTDPDSLVCRFDERWNLRVVAVSADDNTVRVYDKQQVLITVGEDLAVIIRSWIKV
jgi:hypothetical protein